MQHKFEGENMYWPCSVTLLPFAHQKSGALIYHMVPTMGLSFVSDAQQWVNQG